MIGLLEDAAFRNRAIDEQQAWSLIGQAEELLGSVSDP
jgi:hypothetical protein